MTPPVKVVGKISKPGDRWHPKRSLHHGNRAAMRQHNARVGAVIHAYNSSHAAVLMVVLGAAGKDSHQAARSLWFNHSTDAAQREFAAIYCRDNFGIRPPIRRAINWALNALKELARHRNDAAHSDMIWHYDRLQPGLITKDAAYARMQEQPFEAIWKKLQGDLSALSNYLMDLYLDVVNNNTWPSSRRPKLLLVHSQSAKVQDRNRKIKQKARERQRNRSLDDWDASVLLSARS